jgi:hypothetical protein
MMRRLLVATLVAWAGAGAILLVLPQPWAAAKSATAAGRPAPAPAPVRDATAVRAELDAREHSNRFLPPDPSELHGADLMILPGWPTAVIPSVGAQARGGEPRFQLRRLNR